MKQNPTFTSQPYPMWAVILEPDAMWIGLVIGWATYVDDDEVTAYPVVNRLNCNSCSAYQLNDWWSLHLTLEQAQTATVAACNV